VLQAPDRALALLETTASPDARANLPALSIGERDGRLLRFRGQAFGTRLPCVSECPSCGTAIEFELDTDRLQQSASSPVSAGCLHVTLGDIEVQFRLLDCADLAVAAQCSDVPTARRSLLRRCVVAATRAGAVIEPGELPEAVVRAVSERLAESDAQADIVLDLTCPECAAAWPAPFDIASYLWLELSGLAKQLLGEVHTLAWAYGWSETDILAMSDAKRQFYLDAVQ
jgi:hypothetical protein